MQRISIITPSYNQGNFIEETILSVINQDYDNLEFIIIDGGSTDNTVDVIKKYGQYITYWVSEKDSGQSEAINKGLKVCTGDIINWLNSDDLLVPGALKKIAGYFNQHPEAIMVHGRVEYFGDQSYYSSNLSSKNLRDRYAAHICMPQPACFFKRKLIQEQGLLDETLQFSMDTDLYVRAGLNYPIVQVNDVFAKFRLHGGSKSVSSFNINFLNDNRKIFSKVLSTLGAGKQIAELKALDLFSEPTQLYNKPARHFDPAKLIFYFLQHRLYTLHNRSDKEAFNKIFNHLLKYHTTRLLGSFKLLVYKSLLFMPAGIIHSIGRLKSRLIR